VSNDRQLSDVVVRLQMSYAGSVSADAVNTVVNGAERELTGQAPSAALPELIHRLASERLARLAEDVWVHGRHEHVRVAQPREDVGLR
jgi:hypothetical protein